MTVERVYLIINGKYYNYFMYTIRFQYNKRPIDYDPLLEIYRFLLFFGVIKTI
jgi:hypothetical protein